MTSNNHSSEQKRNSSDWSRMALERIKLIKHPGGSHGFKPGGYWVKEETMRTAWRQFWIYVDRLDPNHIYCAQDLAAVADWDDQPRGWRIAMGRCYKYFAVNGVLPITIVNPEAAYNFKYRLNPGLAASPKKH